MTGAEALIFATLEESFVFALGVYAERQGWDRVSPWPRPIEYMGRAVQDFALARELTHEDKMRGPEAPL